MAGNLVEQDVKTLYQGVSRQPDSVRLPGQVQNAENHEFSVVTGGFGKRPGTIDLGVVSGISATDSVHIHSYERDINEKYIVLIRSGSIKVLDINGVEKAVSYPDGVSYLTSSDPQWDFHCVTIADYTIIANKAVTVAMGPAGTGTIYGPTTDWDDLPYKGEAIASYLTATYGTGNWADTSTGCTDGAIWKVSSDSDPKSYYFAKLDKTSGAVWMWKECADPRYPNSFDAATMPWGLIRNADGTFTFKKLTWKPRSSGDPTVCPPPDFVGQKIADIALFRDRLAVASDEVVYFSQAADYFNFWPDKVTLVKDSDPLGRTCTSTSVNFARWGVPFKKSLFVQTDKAQFEISSGDLFTPKKAVIDLCTTYETTPYARPVVLGDILYFAGRKGDRAQIFEYEYHQNTVSNKAVPVTYHVDGYIKHPIVSLAGDASAGILCALSGAERSAIYVYRYFWDGETKAQSAWSKWTFPGVTFIHNIKVIDSSIFILARTAAGSVRLLRLPITNDICESYEPFPIKLDMKRTLEAGVYDNATDTTTFMLPGGVDPSCQIFAGTDTTTPGRQLLVKNTSDTTITLHGNYQGVHCIYGVPYSAYVELSKQFMRAATTQQGKTVTAGRLQLIQVAFDYQDTSYFEVWVTPDGRDTEKYQFTGRVLGSLTNQIGVVPINESGSFEVPVNTRGSTVRIEVVNNTAFPHTITAMWWYGFYNDITQQG